MKEIENKANLEKLLATDIPLENFVFKDLDLLEFNTILQKKELTNCIFLGCTMDKQFSFKLQDNNNTIFPKLKV